MLEHWSHGNLRKGFVRRGEEGRGAVKLAPLPAVAGNAAPLNWGRSADAVAGNDGMLPLVLDYLPHIPVSQQPMELVERKRPWPPRFDL